MADQINYKVWSEVYAAFKKKGLTENMILNVDLLTDFSNAREIDVANYFLHLPNNWSQRKLINRCFRAGFRFSPDITMAVLQHDISWEMRDLLVSFTDMDKEYEGPLSLEDENEPDVPAET